ncbi:MAG: hypothetical protein HY271_17840 [Deltaproteobacteria bacterium]|nr:hypothetical protein [Deltaproteobacteria bacterium]
MRAHRFPTTALVLVLLAPHAVLAADRGIQLSPDGKRVMANKDIGAERWAITFNKDDGTVVGNVFREDGSPPAFVFCRPASEANVFECFGADACAGSPCTNGFSPLGMVTLPSSFFEVPPILNLSGRFATANSQCVDGQGHSIATSEGTVSVVQLGITLTITNEQSGLRYSGAVAGDQVTATASFDVGQAHCSTTVTGTAFNSDSGAFTENIVCDNGSEVVCTYSLHRIT